MDPSPPSPSVRPLRTLSRPVPLGQVAYEGIRRGLMAGGQLEGVDRLIEQDLAARLSMSRTPVRDALHRLALMGFLEPSLGGGYVRRSFSIRDAREHYELRVLLEPVAAELAAGRERAIRLAGAAALLSGTTSPDSAADARFHLGVAELSGNEALARVIANVTERLVGFGIGEPEHDHGGSVRQAHREIASAIQRGDQTARNVMASHLQACEEALIAQLPRSYSERAHDGGEDASRPGLGSRVGPGVG